MYFYNYNNLLLCETDQLCTIITINQYGQVVHYVLNYITGVKCLNKKKQKLLEKLKSKRRKSNKVKANNSSLQVILKKVCVCVCVLLYCYGLSRWKN